MPNLDTWPAWGRRTVRGSYALAYLMLTAAGALGLTWPPGYELVGWAHTLTRISGGMAATAAVICLIAMLAHRWRIELAVVWWIGLGLTGYATVILLYVGPDREWLIFAALIGALLAAVTARGVSLLIFEERTRTRRVRETNNGGSRA